MNLNYITRKLNLTPHRTPEKSFIAPQMGNRIEICSHVACKPCKARIASWHATAEMSQNNVYANDIAYGTRIISIRLSEHLTKRRVNGGDGISLLYIKSSTPTPLAPATSNRTLYRQSELDIFRQKPHRTTHRNKPHA